MTSHAVNEQDDRRLEGRVALVTGAAGGIGQAVAATLAAAGAKVICVDLDGLGASDTADQVGGGSIGLALDVADEKAVADVFAHVRRAGTLDILCNVAGIAGPQVPAEHTSVDEWDQTFAVNTRGTFLMTKHATSLLRSSQGTIINIASALAMIGWRSESAYGPSKAAVVQFTKSAALDLAPDIRVNCVLPGAVLTPMITSVLDGSADLESALVEYGSAHPYGGRLLSPQTIADAVLFLASDDASFITGAALPVDAGMLATGRSAVDATGNGAHAVKPL